MTLSQYLHKLNNETSRSRAIIRAKNGVMAAG